MYRNQLLLLSLLLLLAPAVALAAPLNIRLATVPEYPRPGEQVVVRATAVELLPSQIVVWTVDGVEFTRDKSLSSIIVEAPRAGSDVAVGLRILEGGSLVASGNLTLTTAGVTLEWEGDGRTTPFYTGKPLFTAHGAMLVEAIPDFKLANGTMVDADQIQYTWSVNGSIDQSISGYGRSRVSIPPAFFDQSFTVSVVARASQHGLAAADSLVARPRSPWIAVYETSPLGGLLDERAVLGQEARLGSEITLRAFPMFASTNETFTLEWNVNGERVETAEPNQTQIVLRKQTDARSIAFIELLFRGAGGFLDRAGREFTLDF